MAKFTEPLAAETGRRVAPALARLRNADDPGSDLMPVLDIAIGMTGADMGTLQRFDEKNDCIELAASPGFSQQSLSFFGTVRRDTNTSCAAALTRRMRVFVEDIPTSYPFVGTRELAMLSAGGVAAVQSTPLISSNSRLWGVLSTHFRATQKESAFDPAPLDRLAVQIADRLVQSEISAPHRTMLEDRIGRLT
ncbi:GAF domain-containing protein [Bosea sp. CCNWLW174]|uniref:GAF domain-containing protein n=1 Tax=unclassified Bosea (in: a-proteobacteria) TaxID=2653178 RepID=UPI0030152FD0